MCKVFNCPNYVKGAEYYCASCEKENAFFTRYNKKQDKKDKRKKL